VCLFFFFYFFIIQNSVFAQEALVTPPVNTPTPNFYQEQYESLKQEAIRFENNSRDERQYLLALITVLFIILGFTGISSIRSIKDQAEKIFNEHIKSTNNNLERRIEDWAGKKLYDQFGLNKRILILADKNIHEDIKNEEVAFLNKRGFSHVSVADFDSNLHSSDLIVFCYNDSRNKELTNVITKLEESQKKIPLIGYYTKRILNEKFDSYKYRGAANSPLTLVSWIFTITSSFNS